MVNKRATSLNQPWKNRAENTLVILTYSLLIEGGGSFVLITCFLSISRWDFEFCVMSYFDFPYATDQSLPIDFHLFCMSPESIPAYRYQPNHVLSGELKNQGKA